MWNGPGPGSQSQVTATLDLATTAEASLALPFRLVSSLRAYFLRLDASNAGMPNAVTATCSLTGSTTKAKLALSPVTRFVSDSQMIIWDASFEDAVEATTCTFTIVHEVAVLLAEIEAYE
jgi:hypothetical protein